MNDNENMNSAAAVPGGAGDPQQVQLIRPSLCFYHPSTKGTGCALKMNLHPAHDYTDGSIMVKVANQMTVGDLRGPNPTFPRFDWENPICVKLDFSDLCKMLQVLRGECESLEDGRGIFHRSPMGLTKIVLRHLLEPVSGYSFELYRTSSNGEEARAHIFFSPWEALGISEAIAGSMSVISFGIPMVIPHDTSAYKQASQGVMRHARAA